jgi:hypothetical protein
MRLSCFIIALFDIGARSINLGVTQVKTLKVFCCKLGQHSAPIQAQSWQKIYFLKPLGSGLWQLCDVYNY